MISIAQEVDFSKKKMLMADKILPQETATSFLEVERILFQPMWDVICKQDWMCAYNLLCT
jgi:hypothetical protein